MKITKYEVVFLVALGALIYCLPLLWILRPTLESSDLNLYLISFIQFSNQFWNGEIYPRWLPATNDGIGSPVYIYYGPFSAYLFALLEWLGAYDPNGFIRLFILFFLSIFSSGLLVYGWLKERFDASFSALAAIIYTVIPYKLFPICLQVSLPQVLSHLPMIMCLWGTEKLLREKSGGLMLVCGYALLILTHPPTFLTFAWIPFVYAFFVASKHNRFKTIGYIAILLFIALAVTSFYWLVFWENRPFVQVDRYIGPGRIYTDMYFSIVNDFFFLPHILLLVPAALILYKFSVESHNRGFCIFILFISIVFVCMITPLSIPVLWVFPILEYLQFPSRYYNAFMIPIAICVAYAFWRGKLVVYQSVILSGLFVVTVFTLTFFRAYDDTGKFEYIQSTSFIYAPEYCPRSTPTEFCSLEAQQQYYKKIAPVAVRSGSAVAVHTNKADWPIRANISVMTTSASIVFRHRYFPGIRLVNDLNGQELPIEPSAPDGLIQVNLPKGQYSLSVSFGAPKGSDVAYALSFFGILLFFVLLWYERKKTLQAKTVY
jgi:hypothetical protein